ncbi:hypothetical protein DFR70_104351 [Nocardia tenerifensis]|uniref:Uncharacterized protein n=1 Tax=Nocardia tenerifensis TaxID=228006 RepID=A0A318K5J5_9NOCA|nr:hypothetical protein [Nocardia tenerifensis]PXX65288.1 hypothetical protein DFR70_104351 [Nocardia tenerifensis]
MTAMWFGLAAIALVGAIVLLYFDRIQRQRTGHARQVWAKSQGYTYVSVEPALPSTWRRGALAKLGYLSAVDVVSGIRKGEKFVLFDLEDAATLIAVRRQIGSDIDVDMRLKTASPPKDADLELLGAIGDRVVFATNPEIARHAVDQRMVAFIETLPDTVQMLWSEGNWTLGMLSIGTSAREWENSIDAVLRLSGLLHVLPPVSEPRFDGGGHDPGRPRPRGRQRPEEPDAEEPDEAIGGARVQPPRLRKGEDFDEAPFGEPGYDEDRAPLSAPDEPEPPRRPSLAVVPDARARVREERRTADEWSPERRDDWSPEPRDTRAPEPRDKRAPEPRDKRAPERDEPPADEWTDEPDRHGPARADDAATEPPGGPFHPGFRPYQGPVPQ